MKRSTFYLLIIYLITLIIPTKVYAVEEVKFDYTYTGDYQEFVAPYTGEYKLEVWGAGGGGQHQAGSAGVGGLGGYSKGLINLRKGDKLYIYVGGEGKTCITAGCTASATFNGGGSGYKKKGDVADPVGSGGGATDMRFVSGAWNDASSLLSRVIVAGGGGGGGMETNEHGGDGGGVTGTRYNNSYGAPGTQNKGWAFGYGYSCSPSTINYVNTTWGGSGAGGGWYGGYNSAGSGWHGAGGGSGFVWTQSSAENVPSGYSVLPNYYLTDAETLAGNQKVPTHDGDATMTGTRGNGYAKITLTKIASPLDVVFPIYSDDIDFSPFYENNSVDLEILIPTSPLEITLKYDTTNYIWGNNVGKVLLEDGKTLEVTLMDRNGEISVYKILPTLGRAKLKNILYDKAIFEFEPDVYKYEFFVDYSIKEFEPIIEAENNINYTMSDSKLAVGENIIKINVEGAGLKSSVYTFKITRNYKEYAGPTVNNFAYTGAVQEFVAPYTADYLLEVWGASGGGSHQYSDGGQTGAAGRGGYSKGIVRLTEGEKIYIYVGGQGSYRTSSPGTVLGGYNGGGYAWKTTSDHWTVFSGGGATDMRLFKSADGAWNNSSSLLSRIIVAGGGGGGSMLTGIGGHGGGTNGTNSTGTGVGIGGSQTSGPTGASFGKGADSTAANGATSNWGSSGGGSGWYGGGLNGWGAGGGGSGFIYTEATKANVPSGYTPTSKYYLKKAQTIVGNQAVPNYNNPDATMTGNLGHGYARITYYNPEELDEIIDISVDKGEMSPSFDKDINEYELSLNLDDTKIEVKAETLKGEGLLTGTGIYEIAPGQSEIIITFTNTQGQIDTYKLKVSRPGSADATLKGFKVNGILYKDFDPAKTEYEIEIPTEVEKINLELIKAYPGQVVPEDTKYDFPDIELTKTIVVESELSLTNQVYTFKFVRKKSSELKTLSLSIGSLDKIFNPKITDYNLEVYNFVREIPMEAIPYFPDAKVSIVENRYVGVDDKKITITVELDGVPKTVYNLNIVRTEPMLEPIDEGYKYTGDYQTFTAPNSAYYTLEVWGASGGGRHQYADGSNAGVAGSGGYSRGTVYLNAGDKIYVYVGGQGSYKTTSVGTVAGGYNGGGYAWKTTNDHWTVYSGGGATDMRFVSGTWNDDTSLKSRVIVAGGGGGASMQSGYGGAGGGEQGGISNQFAAQPGTQTSAPVGASFGKGADSTAANGAMASWGSSGGGSGWYGGGVNSWGAGAGGSGFIWTKETSKIVPDGYSVKPEYYLKDAETIMGNQKVPTHDGTNLMNGNLGNGYARITANPGIVGDTFLDNIIVDNNPTLIKFYPWELTYEINLTKEYEEVLIEAIAKSADSKISGIGTIKLKPGLNEHKIIVTTEDGASKTYNLNITREPSDDSMPTNILLKNPQNYLCNISSTYCNYTFDKDIDTYEILLPFETEMVTLEAVLKSEYQSAKYFTNEEDADGQKVRNEVEKGIFTLHSGLNILEVDIISEDGVHTTTYVYKINKDDSGNNNLLKLEITNPEVDINFSSYIYEYYFNIDSTYDELELDIVVQNPNATYEVQGNENLKQGMNDISVVVKAENGNTKTYILHVFKEQSTNTFLSSLVVKDNNGADVEITPIFQKILTEYSASVDASVSSINIEAVAEEGTVMGSGEHALTSGNNRFEIKVTSESGEIEIYVLNIYKAKNNNSDLLNIEVEGYTLEPEFTKDNKTYNLKIPKSVTSLKVNVTPVEQTTTYTIKGENNLTSTYSSIIITSIAEDKSYQVYEIKVEKETDKNNYLKEIIVDNMTLNEQFDKENLNYTIDVLEDTSSLTITGIPESVSSIVKGNGTYALVSGKNIINLVVTSEDRLERTYTITVNKPLGSDTTLKEVTNSLNSVVIENNDSEKKYDYLINVQYEVTNIFIDGIANSKSSVVTGGKTVNLQPGINDMTLRVTSESGSYQDYVVRIIRDLSYNDDLKFLYVEEGGLQPSFNETTIFYDVYVPNVIDSADKLHIEAIAEDKDATIEIIGNSGDLEVNVPKEIQITVTAPNGKDKKTYTLSVIRQEESTENLALINLETNRGELEPTFNPDILNYELTVPNSVADITVIAEAFSPEDVIITGANTYNLHVGKNALSVFVKSKSTGIEKDYQIVVTRKVSNDASLSNLVVKSHILSPAFNKEIFNYNVTTSLNELEFTTIKTTEADATYEVIGNNNFESGSNTVTIRVTAPDGETTKDYVINVDKARSKNNNLSNLVVDGQTLTPVFHKGVTFYTIEVPRDLNSVVINATPEDSASIVEGTGLKNLVSGENYFDVIVTSEAGTKKTYTVLIVKEGSNNNYLSSLYVSEGILTPIFDKMVTNYEVTVPYTVKNIDISGTLEDNSANVSGFKNYELVTGENVIEIVVTSESGDLRIYQITINKEPLISAYLTSLSVPNYELDQEFNKDLTEYYINVDYEVSSLIPNYVTEDVNASVTISGNTNLVVGMNEVHINVTASDGSLEKDYVIYVNRGMSTNNFLTVLAVDGYSLTPTFNPEELIYNLTVPRDVESVNVTAVAQDASATITSGVGEHSLKLGLNVIEVKVKSMIGITRTYKINIEREQSANNYLQSLIVAQQNSNLSLEPNFNKLINSYTINAPSDVNFVQIKASAEDNNAIVTGSGIKELTSGTNHFEITVTAENGSINTYVIDIIKEISNNNNLLTLIPSDGVLFPTFDKNILEYTLDLEYEVDLLSFSATLESNLSSVKGLESSVVPEGNSTRLIIVTAEDGSAKTYKINVVKETASNALLESLEIEGYPIEFDPNTFVYNISVSKSKKELLESEIRAIPKDSEATVNLMGDITLGEDIINVYTIEVIAKDGYTTEEYTLNITRDSEEYTIRSEVYDIRREEVEFPYVIGIEPDTNMSVFKDKFLNDNELLKLYDKNNQLIEEESKLVGTAMTLKLEKDGYVYDEVKVIVRGDLNYDGKVNGADQLTMDNFIVKIVKFDGYQQLAADITKDGKVNGADQLSMDNYIVKILKKLN